MVAEKETNKGAFKETKVWKTERSLTFKEVGRNKFLIEFQTTTEKNRVLLGRPWSFDRNLVCLQEFEGSYKRLRLLSRTFLDPVP